MARNYKKKGVLWVNDYHKLFPLANSGMSAEHFINYLEPLGNHYIGFEKGDNNPPGQRAQDLDIQHKKLYSTNGEGPVYFPPGNDDQVAETVDILYFCGHGDPGNIYFDEVGTQPYSNESAYYEHILLGDGIIKWLFLDACSVLENKQLNDGSYSIFKRWAKIFKPGGSLRYLFGFHTPCKNDNMRGKLLAQKLNAQTDAPDGEFIRLAWQYACENTDSGEWAYLRAGAPGDSLQHDRWTKTTLSDIPDINPRVFTYMKRVGPAVSSQQLLS